MQNAGSQISWIVPNLELISSIMSVCDVMYVIWMATCSCVADYIDQCLIRIDYLGSWDSGTGIKDIKVFQRDCMANLRREETQSISITIIIHFGIRTSPPLKKTRRTIQRITQLASRAVPSASHLTYLASLADKAAVTKRHTYSSQPPEIWEMDNSIIKDLWIGISVEVSQSAIRFAKFAVYGRYQFWFDIISTLFSSSSSPLLLTPFL